MVVQLSTQLNISAARAWAAVKQSATLIYVTHGLLGFSAVFPNEWREGESVRTRLFLFGLIPIWMHELEFIRIDNELRELRTRERGGLISAWNHVISVAAKSDECCIYTDSVEISAGVLTPLVWLYAQIFYRHRRRRWNRLARSLS